MGEQEVSDFLETALAPSKRGLPQCLRRMIFSSWEFAAMCSAVHTIAARRARHERIGPPSTKGSNGSAPPSTNGCNGESVAWALSPSINKGQ